MAQTTVKVREIVDFILIVLLFIHYLFLQYLLTHGRMAEYSMAETIIFLNVHNYRYSFMEFSVMKCSYSIYESSHQCQ